MPQQVSEKEPGPTEGGPQDGGPDSGKSPRNLSGFLALAAASVALAGSLFFGLEQLGARMTDLSIDGVPLPGDAAPLQGGDMAASGATRFAGTWVGTWDGKLKHVMVVEAIESDGKAKVIYAIGGNPAFKRKAAWFRYNAAISGDTLKVFGDQFEVTYELGKAGRLRGAFGGGGGYAVLSRRDFASISKPGAAIAWSSGKSELLNTTLVEDGKPVRLEAVVYVPPGDGPFPLAVINHGSTGAGTDKASREWTWRNEWFADVLNGHGYIAAFPQRRGRGKSDGLYDEGFSKDRAKGYTCDPTRSLAGADRALEDLEAAVAALRLRSDVKDGPILVGGESRGGTLSVLYAGRHASDVSGVINFVGGWLGTGCTTASDVNQKLFNEGATFGGSMLWIYGQDDPYYPMAHSRENFAAFKGAGGTGSFVEVTVPGKNNGHYAMIIPPLWMSEVGAYLDGIPNSPHRASGAQ